MMRSNAGICPFHTFLDMPPEIWEITRSVNLDGSFYVVQGMLPQLTYCKTPELIPIFSRSQADGKTDSPRRLHYCRLIYQRTRWRRPPNPLHPYESWYLVFDAVLCGCSWQVQYPMQRSTTWYASRGCIHESFR